MKTYYIIAMNDMPRVVRLDNDKLQEEERKLTNLAYIDLLTSKYSEATFKRYLFNKGIITNLNTPVFIVHEYNYNKQRKLKIQDIVFKGEYSNLVDNLALTTLRRRIITLQDAIYLVELFQKKYDEEQKFMEFANYMINEHDINLLLNCNQKSKKKSLSYSLLRDVVACLNQYKKYEYIEDYYCYSDIKPDIYKKIYDIMPDKVARKKSEEVKVLSVEEAKNIKTDGQWDNVLAKDLFKNDTVNAQVFMTLTLEDRLRSGLIDECEYVRTRYEREKKYRG